MGASATETLKGRERDRHRPSAASAAQEAATSKLRGGYYTPDVLADFLTSWAVTSRKARVLEPSAGDGIFVSAASRRATTGQIDAVELFADEAEKIRVNYPERVGVFNGDLFEWYSADRDGTYDAVLGNPPFIRYQSFPEPHRRRGFALMHAEGLRPNRLTNAWVPFVVVATRALKPGGRLAMVLPAELLQVTYAGELREYLVRKFSKLTVLTFRRLVFHGIQQETVLLLGTRAEKEGAASVSFVELENANDLPGFVGEAVEGVVADLDHGREKWTQYYLSARELDLIRALEKDTAFTTLGELAEVDVGIVTGRNEFFVLSPTDAEILGLRRQCLPLVGRSAQIPGLVLTSDEWRELASSNGRCLLLQLGRTDRNNLTPNALAYVEQGEAAGHHSGYKCRIRLPNWWYVPSTQAPDAFMLRQIHDGPKIIVNQAGATCTDTIHRVTVKRGIDPSWLAAASMNSLTFAFSEIRGRSYGGGVLELEPNEANGLPFPRPGQSLPIQELDLWARRKEPAQILDEVDRLVLQESGICRSDIALLRGIWEKLSQRRMDRKRR